MKYIIILILLSVSLQYTISMDEVLDCVSKSCDNEQTQCSANSDCAQAQISFNECFKANRYNVTLPYYECKGVANQVYADLMVCYETCDYNLILHKQLIIVTLITMLSIL